VKQEAMEALILMLSPIVPHICHALWQALGHQDAIMDASWPKLDTTALVRSSVEMVVQINGKVRASLHIPTDASPDFIEKAALDHESIQRHLQGKTPKKIIVVGKKLVNIVVSLS